MSECSCEIMDLGFGDKIKVICHKHLKENRKNIKEVEKIE